MDLFNGHTTKNIFLGKPEAEAEQHNIIDYFEDYFNVGENIERGSFIISGRKGSGKSAYAVWLQQKSKIENDIYSSIVRKSDFDLEAIINSVNYESQKYEAFFEWIILVRFVKMILDSKIGMYLNQYKALEKFYDKNAGYVNIDKYTISEIINNKEVNFAPLKSQFGFFNKLFSSKSIKAPFYQMITPLRDIIKEMLQMELYGKARFYVMFDDLDVKLKLNRDQDKTMLLDLVRVARRYNNEYLQDTSSKVLIFLRDDICDKLGGADADKNKIFSSYEYCINWYEHDLAIQDESQVLLRKFINKRLLCAFKKANIKYDETDPWRTFVYEEPSQKSSFKYILDHTFYLPRDILCIFKNIHKKNFKLPLSHRDINILLREYAPIKKAEIEDELCVIFNKNTVDKIFKVLEDVNYEANADYDCVLELLHDNDLDISYFPILIEYSLLVPMDDSYHYYFNYREHIISKNYEMYNYTIPKVLKLYFKDHS